MSNERNDLAQRYRQFGQQQARGSSASFERWAEAVAGDADVLALLAALPASKQQPNLVLAAARWHGAEPGDSASLRQVLVEDWAAVRSTILRWSTQTNEPARCAVLLPLFHRIQGPIALIELGAAAGLCLIPDRYSYRYSDGTTVDPSDGPSPTVIHCKVAGRPLPTGLSTPEIVWRAGLDLNPLDPGDPGAAAWLDILVWPEHDERRSRLRGALALAAADPPRVDRADLHEGLQGLLDSAPSGATVVVQHSATFAYLDSTERQAASDAITASGARWISFEGRGATPIGGQLPPPDVDTLFVAGLDGGAVALAGSHGNAMTMLDSAAHPPFPA